MANQTNQKDPAIKSTEHDVGKILSTHVPPTSAAAPAPLTPATLQPTNRPGLQNLRAIPMAAPVNNNLNLFSLNQNLQLNLMAWKPKGPVPQALKKDMGAELIALNDILFQQTLEADVEDKEAKSLTVSPSDQPAPSMERLRQDLAAIEAFEPTLPPALAAAVEKFTEEFDRCFPAAAPAHPKPQSGHHLHANTPDAVPQPEE